MPDLPEAPPRLLLDLREGEILRGFHVAAAAMLMLPFLASTTCHALIGANGDEQLALDVLRHDTNLPIPCWTAKQGVELLLLAADRWPDDAVTTQAVAAARATLFACTDFALPGAPSDAQPPPSVVQVNGHDTAAVAATVRHLLGFAA